MKITGTLFGIALLIAGCGTSTAGEIVCVEVEVPIFKSVPRADVQSDLSTNTLGGMINFILGTIVSPGSYSSLMTTTNQIIDKVNDYDTRNEIVGYHSEYQCHYIGKD
jgi:hypothetical protein